MGYTSGVFGKISRHFFAAITGVVIGLTQIFIPTALRAA